MSRVAGLLARFGAVCQRSCSALSEATAAAAPSCSYTASTISSGPVWRPSALLHGQAPWPLVVNSLSGDSFWRGFATGAREAPPNCFVSLGNLRDNPGATRQRIRVGRGDSGRRGNYGGRGMKGQKSRGRGLHMLYDGGQLGLLKFPVVRQRPSYEVLYYHLGLSRVMEFVQLGLLDPSRTITMKDLYDTGCVTSNIKYGVLLYGKVQLSFPLDIHVTACDPDTRTCVEAAGGHVVRVYYTMEGITAIMHPEKYTSRRLPLPLPAAKWHPRYDKKFDAIGQIPPVVRTNALPASAAPEAASTAALATA